MKDVVLIHSNPTLDAAVNHAMAIATDWSVPLLIGAIAFALWRMRKVK